MSLYCEICKGCDLCYETHDALARMRRSYELVLVGVFIHARSMRQYRVREIIEASADVRRLKAAHLTSVAAADQ